MIETFSRPIKFKEGDGILHGFTTGKVKVKSKFRTAKGNVITSKINFLLDKQWTEYMPIMVWVIDHPEGTFVIDTGENKHVTDQNYFKKEGAILNYINTKSFIFDVKENEEVGPQLKKLGICENNIKSVVLTHLHLDHFDGLKYFKNSDIMVNKLEWDKPSFALPSLYPGWFEPQTVDLKSTKDHYFNNSFDLVKSGEIKMVHTPGHTLGHCSVLIKSCEIHYFLSGDATYNQLQLEKNINAGGHQSFSHSMRTFQKIKGYASKQKLVYLPSHDSESLDRLKNDIHLNL